MNIGISINVALAKKQMSRDDLSKAAKVTKPYLSAVINGKMTPKISTVDRIAGAFDMPVSEFIKLGE